MYGVCEIVILIYVKIDSNLISFFIFDLRFPLILILICDVKWALNGNFNYWINSKIYSDIVLIFDLKFPLILIWLLNRIFINFHIENQDQSFTSHFLKKVYLGYPIHSIAVARVICVLGCGMWSGVFAFVNENEFITQQLPPFAIVSLRYLFSAVRASFLSRLHSLMLSNKNL